MAIRVATRSILHQAASWCSAIAGNHRPRRAARSRSRSALCFSGEWPAFRGGPDHAGVTSEVLQLPLDLAWQYQPTHPPQPAFRGGLAPSKNRVESITYDYVFEPVVAAGRLFFGSSSEDAVFCLDSATGEALWTFTLRAGSIRAAGCGQPAVLRIGRWPRVLPGRGERLADLEASSRTRPTSVALGTVESFRHGPCGHPSRSPMAWCILVRDSFPRREPICAPPDADTGQLLWRRPIPYSPHGEILIEGDTLVVATGRTAPAEFRRSDGQPLVGRAEPATRTGRQLRREGERHVGLGAGRVGRDVPARVAGTDRGPSATGSQHHGRRPHYRFAGSLHGGSRPPLSCPSRTDPGG